MTHYDLLNLSPFEFEALVRDLLQAYLKIRLKSFGPGKDQGIDLRYAQGDGIIIQCKRYSDSGVLWGNLQKEIEKVRVLNPSRYILVTSVSMSPERKRKIVELFNPYILSTSDVFGREDINNLIVQYPKVERDNFKLWLSSTQVLQTIISSQVINQSRFVLGEIKEKVKVYVQNASFFEAQTILSENNYIVISGIPGIGKTTLAEILVYDILANGFEEFVYLSDSILNGFRLFNEDRAQVFLFDDFLGSNFLHVSIGTNEEMQILKFIKRIKESENKRLIFTTREYILNQAKQKFERFEQTNFVKCILDLSKYTTNIKAKILYNHLYINHIPYQYVAEVIQQDCLMKIIEHRNYSPRIIENFSRREFWESLRPDEFPIAVLQTFDLPFSIWEHAFEHQISNLAKIILLTITITGPQISYQQLYEEVKKFNSYSLDLFPTEINPHRFKFAIKELDNSFITTTRTAYDTFIKYQNPSIRDFLISYLNANEEILIKLIKAASYLSEFLSIFSNRRQNAYREGRVSLTPASLKAIEERISLSFDSFVYTLEDFRFSQLSEDDIIVLKLFAIKQTLQNASSKIHDFIKFRFQQLLYSENIGYRALIPYTELLTFFYSEKENIDVARILYNIAPSIDDEEHITILEDFRTRFPVAYKHFKDDEPEGFKKLFDNIIRQKTQVNNDDTGKLSDNVNALQEIEEEYGIDLSEYREYLNEEIQRINDMLEQINFEYGVHPFREKEPKAFLESVESKKKVEKNEEFDKQQILSEKQQIENIFKSLK